jgi:hypothetical protein
VPKLIFKYDLHGPTTVVPTHEGARAISVLSTKGDRAVVYLEVDTEKPIVRRTFRSVPTGGVVPEGKHVGIFTVESGVYVWHVYDCGEAPL